MSCHLKTTIEKSLFKVISYLFTVGLFLVTIIEYYLMRKTSYTGHCPTLKFYYGQSYGARTRAILKKRHDNDAVNPKKGQYRSQSQDFGHFGDILKPIKKSKDQFRDFALDHKAPKYIIGYTGFIPTLNFRYGKSYGQTAEESAQIPRNIEKRAKMAKGEISKMFETNKHVHMNAIRSKDEVKEALKKYINEHEYKIKSISAEDPPIAGYTGHIPRVKGNEESLSHRYNTVVKRGLGILQQEKEEFEAMKKAQKQLSFVMEFDSK